MLTQEYFDSLPPGWSALTTVHKLYELASTLKPGQTILEIGSFVGRSTVNMANATNHQVSIVSVDKLDDAMMQTRDVPKNIFNPHKWDVSKNLGQHFEMFTKDYPEISRVPLFYPVNLKLKASMIYLDASRRYHEIMGHLTYALENHLADDGFICGPHYYETHTGPAVIGAVNDFAAMHSFNLEVDEPSSVWVLTRK